MSHDGKHGLTGPHLQEEHLSLPDKLAQSNPHHLEARFAMVPGGAPPVYVPRRLCRFKQLLTVAARAPTPALAVECGFASRVHGDMVNDRLTCCTRDVIRDAHHHDNYQRDRFGIKLAEFWLF